MTVTSWKPFALLPDQNADNLPQLTWRTPAWYPAHCILRLRHLPPYMPKVQHRNTMNRLTSKSPSNEPRMTQLRPHPGMHGHVNRRPAIPSTNHRKVLIKPHHHYRPAPINPSPNTQWAARMYDSREPHQPNKRHLYRTHQAPPTANRTHWMTQPLSGNNHYQDNNLQPTGSNNSHQPPTQTRNRMWRRR